MSTKNLYKQNFKVDRLLRIKNLNQTPRIMVYRTLRDQGNQQYLMHWNILFEKGFKTYSLDGDNIRLGLCKGLDFLLKKEQKI